MSKNVQSPAVINLSAIIAIIVILTTRSTLLKTANAAQLCLQKQQARRKPQLPQEIQTHIMPRGMITSMIFITITTRISWIMAMPRITIIAIGIREDIIVRIIEDEYCRDTLKKELEKSL